MNHPAEDANNTPLFHGKNYRAADVRSIRRSPGKMNLAASGCSTQLFLSMTYLKVGEHSTRQFHGKSYRVADVRSIQAFPDKKNLAAAAHRYLPLAEEEAVDVAPVAALEGDRVAEAPAVADAESEVVLVLADCNVGLDVVVD